MRLIAITGSIGCGKTTLSDILRGQGFLVYDIDKWVKYIYYKKSFLNYIKDFFPEAFKGNVFDKRELRNLVFNNPQKLKLLESIIHPFLEKRFRQIIRSNKNDGLVFVDVALLFEMEWDKYFDFIILADVEKEIQKQRVMKRDNITAEDFEKIDKLQMPMEEKREKVDFVINTGIEKKKLTKSVLEVLEVLKEYE